MSIIKPYKAKSQNEGNSPKGSIDNPYSESEYNSMLDNGTWPGGYVEGLGYCLPGVDVITSMPDSDSWGGSDSWGSEETHTPHPQPDNPDTPSGNGGNGTGEDTTSQNSEQEQTEASLMKLIAEASTFSKKVAERLNNLKNNNKIIWSNDTNIEGARWLSKLGVMQIGPNATSENLLHELTHSLQEDGPHSNKEWQAYMMDMVYGLASDMGATSKIMCMNENTLNAFIELLGGNSGKNDNGNLYVTSGILNYLNSLDYEYYVNYFINYCREHNMPQSYTDGYSKDYNWNWEYIITEMGILIVE